MYELELGQKYTILVNEFRIIIIILKVKGYLTFRRKHWVGQGCVGVFVWPVAVDITKMISDREGIPRLVRGTLSGTGTIIQCYPLVRAFLYPPPEDTHGCQHVPARSPRVSQRRETETPSYHANVGVRGA